MSNLIIPFGSEADEIVLNTDAERYQYHRAAAEAADQQVDDLEHHLATACMTEVEYRAAVAGRAAAMRDVLRHTRMARMYKPCQCRPGGESR